MRKLCIVFFTLLLLMSACGKNPDNQKQLLVNIRETTGFTVENNGQYVQMAQEYLTEGFVVRQLRTEYKQQAKLGDVICPRVARAEGKIFVCLDDENQNPYTILEFSGK